MTIEDREYIYGKDIDIDFFRLNRKTRQYLSNFSCGNPAIDDYFRTQAFDDHNTVTHIFIDKQKDTAIALVSISCSKVDYVQSMVGDDNDRYYKYISSTPAVEIKYFATDKKYHSRKYDRDSNRTLSKVIMSKMISYIYKLSEEHIGASKIILNSLPDAVNFYTSCSFKKYEKDMSIPNVDGYGCVYYHPMYFNLLPDDCY